MKYSYLAAKKINDLGLPVFFVVGNHDLYHRHTREVHSVIPFQEFSNFRVIDSPTIIEEIHNKALFSPFLFHDEYAKMTGYLKLPFWAGHFEFKDFMVTGYGMKMPTGPDAMDFKGPKYIVSGHFHKRQHSDNIVYIGNTFPMDFGDASKIRSYIPHRSA
jgi:DNA repair exonuclease SbcCD nuclease subunit